MQTPTKKPFYYWGALFVLGYASVGFGCASLQKKKQGAFFYLISEPVGLF
jgi:hypothetical protein